jgi:purine-nucleoside phosphorylase
MSNNLYYLHKEIVDSVRAQIPFEPEICIVLGSGLGDFAEKIGTICSIATSSLPGYPISTVQGHNGYLHFSEYSGKKLLIVQGRIHIYEGYSISRCILPVHIAYHLNCRKILLTNAAGGINKSFIPGDLMLATSLIGINIKKELTNLIGLATIEMKNKFLDFPSQEINSHIRQAAAEEKIPIREGVYWMTKGPSYETPAEIRMIGNFGGDAVGMSTVHEAVYGASIGMNVGSVSCITNFAAGLSGQKLSHSEVMETAEHVKIDFERLVKKSITLL